MIGWISANCIVPIIVFAKKFGLFESKQVYTDSLGNIISSVSSKLNGWGIISCILIGLTLTSIVKEIASAYTGYSLTKQCFDGIVKSVIPLGIAYAVCYFLNGVIAQVMFCLGTLIICKCVAIPLNPLPKWKYEKRGVEDYTDALSYLTKLVKSKEKGDSQ